MAKSAKEVSKPKSGELIIDFASPVSRFERLMKKLRVKNILYKRFFRGKGLEFDYYRQFSPTDDASQIDWSASLRSSELLVRSYIEERDFTVYFLLDVGSSMLFGSGKKLKAEHAAEIVAAISHLVIKSNDRIGMVMFNDGISKFLKESNKTTQFGLFRKYLADSSLYGGGFDLNGAVDFALRNAISKFTVFIIVSDFISMDRRCERKLKILSSEFETVAIMVRDYFDEHLPETPYQLALQDPYSRRQIVVDPSIASKRFRANVLRRKALIRKVFKAANIDLLELDIAEDFVIPTSRFFIQRVGRRI